VQLPAGTVIVPGVVGIPIDTTEIVIVTPAQSLPGTTHIDVYAQNNINSNLYTVGFTFPNGIQGMQADAVSVFPNPASEKVFISGAGHSLITIYSFAGDEIQRVENFTGNSLSLSGFQKGIYILKIVQPAGGVVQKKIVVQ
jgi:hypothetical protein